MSSQATPNLNLPSRTPLDSSVVAQPIPQDAIPHRWSVFERVGFRFAFCYFGGYCVFGGNATAWNAIPVLGYRIQNATARLFTLPAEYLAQHLFHVAVPGNSIHPTGSGDTAINWISVLLLLLVSFAIAAVWTALDRTRPHYQTLSAWLRFIIRLTLGIGMVSYGIDKLFPLQMPQPPISSLSEPLGMHSPMNLLWSFIGLNPWYESVCGAAELLAGLLILFRRTALAGALFTAFVAGNVLLYNLAFDVPVKLYSGHLFLLSCFLILPDAAALWRFFWRHEPAAPTGVWVPPARRPWFRRGTQIIEIAFAVVIIGPTLFFSAAQWRQERAALDVRCDLCSAWRVGRTEPKAPWPFQGSPTEFVINSRRYGMVRRVQNRAMYFELDINDQAHTVGIKAPNQKTSFQYVQNDPLDLVLLPLGTPSSARITLTRTTPLGGYPLLQRGFHWISEYPYQR